MIAVTLSTFEDENVERLLRRGRCRGKSSIWKCCFVDEVDGIGAAMFISTAAGMSSPYLLYDYYITRILVVLGMQVVRKHSSEKRHSEQPLCITTAKSDAQQVPTILSLILGRG